MTLHRSIEARANCHLCHGRGYRANHDAHGDVDVFTCECVLDRSDAEAQAEEMRLNEYDEQRWAERERKERAS